MKIDAARIQTHLQSFDFSKLFIEELGWDRPGKSLEIPTEGTLHHLEQIAQKRGMAVFLHVAAALPEYSERRKIERQVVKYAHEHIIIFADSGKTTQIWQWVKREAGKPVACREHTLHKSQSGKALIQKLEAIAFSIEDEEALTLVDVTRGARAGFDLERVTKKFYERFKNEHENFLEFIEGISEKGDKEWYASLMLNRLMFVYFIQHKGFLDGDKKYLRNRLQQVKATQGDDKFHSFYRYFLLRLFHEGLGAKDRSKELEKLIGKIPYLNGGLFEKHAIEVRCKEINIPDKAFEDIFNYFDEYQWHLDERPLRKDDEINPDVLGYIFEKYINQKQMGAYYTKEDITEYIGKNTIIPFLFDAAKAKCKIAFENTEGPTIWDLLKSNPDRYIYPAIKHGMSWDYNPNDPVEKGKPLDKLRPLPPEIEKGVDTSKPKLLERRKDWNKAAPPEYALPTEIWRETVARRQRYKELHRKLSKGEVRDINELITLNLDIRQFAQDVIENAEGPELLRAFWHAIEKVTILDPTCGSGAFLFAALNILEPLYEACLDRMESFVQDIDCSTEKHSSAKFPDFRELLKHVDSHPSRSYFIFKSIILKNLFGVDIMEEATEICKLRLFLKLAAQVEPDSSKDNFGIEPLPDIDFNIRPGNTLVGYSSVDDVKKATSASVDTGSLGLYSDAFEPIKEKAEEASIAFKLFRQMQTEKGMDSDQFVTAKQKLREKLRALNDELNCYLASEYGIDTSKQKAYEKWLKSYQPFHWFVEFYEIISKGGFDVIIGNPPYVEYKDVKDTYCVKGFQSEQCGDLYAFCTERAVNILAKGGKLGLIVPISIFGTDGFETLQKFIIKELSQTWISCFSNRPAQLFDGAQKRLTILLGTAGVTNNITIYTTQYFRWKKDEFKTLFSTRIQYALSPENFSVFNASLEKLGRSLEVNAFSRMIKTKNRLLNAVREGTQYKVYYTRKFGYFLAFLDFVPSLTEIKTRRHILPSELKDLEFDSPKLVYTVVSILSSSSFFWFWNVLSDCRNLNRRDLLAFPLDPMNLDSETNQTLAKLGKCYLNSLRKTSKIMIKSGLEIETFDYSTCKPIIDEIDKVLAKHYGFTEEELDFIINYDIKYRMGREAEVDAE